MSERFSWGGVHGDPVLGFWIGIIFLLASGGLNAAKAPPSFAQIQVSSNFDNRELQIRWSLPGNAFQFVLDDAPDFRKPLLAREVKGNSLNLDPVQVGVTPGVSYYVRVGAVGSSSGSVSGTFRIKVPAWSESYLNYAYLRKAWEASGREWIHKYAGTKWNGRQWQIDPAWLQSYGDRVGAQAYYAQFSTLAAINMGQIAHDLPLLDEVAGFFVAYNDQFTTLGSMRAEPGRDKSLLKGQGRDSTRTLRWVEKQPNGDRIRECELCNVQFLYPAARLIRIVTTLPAGERTPLMAQFVKLYSPLIARDNLLRYLYEAEVDYYGAKDLPKQLVPAWQAIVASNSKSKPSYQKVMQDRDLWLMAGAAEMLGANANEPGLIGLTPDEVSRLQEAIRVGIEFFQKSKTVYRDTRNLQGQTVGSASYFNGDFDDHPDMAYSGYSDAEFPGNKPKKVAYGASWDCSHFVRVPIFLRALYDNRKASGSQFPGENDVVLITNQLMYRAFQGNFDRPLFNNFFDGTNGWYRVGYHGNSGFGHPPVQYCDLRNPLRECMTTGEVQAWGLVSHFNPDLMKLEHSLLEMAWRNDSQTQAFKDRYYEYLGTSYAFKDAKGNTQYPVLLFWVMSEVPEKLQGSGGD